MKLLLIEDNKRLCDRIKHQLGKSYVIDVVHAGQDGIATATETQYVVIILDLGLPDITGLSVCQQLRALHVDSPILILTGFDEVRMRVLLLDSGADDYITKPFDSNELRARVAALARRQSLRHTSSTLTLRDLVIDTERRTVHRSGKHIELRRKEFDILEYLVNNSGRVLTREMIINHAWDSSKTSWNSTVDVHIKHLRDKIDRPFSSPLIKTAYGLGYRVDAPD
jgi:DNA-binding response OmpR family regulator